MMKRLILLLFIFLMSVPMTAIAQDERDLLYFTADGILYGWDMTQPEPEPMTSDGYIDWLVPAPSGDLIAFVWHQTDAMESFNSYYVFSEQFERDDLYVIEAGDLKKLYAISGMIQRPTWSSDATQLIWTQGTVAEQNNGYLDWQSATLRYYDVERNQVTGIETVEDRYYFSGGDGGESFLARPLWAGNYITFQQSLAGPETMLRLETTRGTDPLQRILIANVLYSGGVQVVDVTTDNGQSIGLFYERYGQWDLVNPLTLESHALEEAVVDAVSPNAPDTSFSWRIAPTAEDTRSQTWHLYNADEELVQSLVSRGQPFAFSSDGTATAYFDENGIHVIQQDGSTANVAIEGVSSIAWGAIQWHVADDVAMPDSEQPYYFDKTDCDTSVTIGDKGNITAGIVEFYSHSRPLRYIRYDLPEGTPIQVIGGPICRDALEQRLVYWQVEAHDKIGWVSESVFSVVTDE